MVERQSLFLTATKKADDNYAHALDFVPDCYKTHKNL